MKAGSQGALLRNASLVLGVINILQPVDHHRLAAELGEKDDEGLTATLRFLLGQKYIRALPDKSYRTTWLGQNALWSKVLVRRRDIQRMWYLSEMSDGIRRGEGGEAS